MDEIDYILSRPIQERRDEIIRAISVMQNQPDERADIEFIADILSMLTLLCRDRETYEQTAALGRGALQALQQIDDEQSAKAANFAAFLAMGAGLSAAGNITAMELQRIAKRMSGLNAENSEKAATIERARALAAELWQADTDQEYRLLEMANVIRDALEREGFEDLPKAGSIKEWIRPVAPDYASNGGAPKGPRKKRKPV